MKESCFANSQFLSHLRTVRYVLRPAENMNSCTLCRWQGEWVSIGHLYRHVQLCLYQIIVWRKTQGRNCTKQCESKKEVGIDSSLSFHWLRCLFVCLFSMCTAEIIFYVNILNWQMILFWVVFWLFSITNALLITVWQSFEAVMTC